MRTRTIKVNKKKFGSNTKKTQKIVDQLLDTIRRGASIELACDIVGISSQCLRDWRSKDPELDMLVQASKNLNNFDYENSIYNQAVAKGDGSLALKRQIAAGVYQANPDVKVVIEWATPPTSSGVSEKQE